MQTPPTPACAAHRARAVGAYSAHATSRAVIPWRTVSSHAIVWNERTSTRPRSARVRATRHTAAAVARASSGSPWAVTSTCTGRPRGASFSSSSRSIGVSSVRVPSRARRRASRRSLHSVWCAQPRNVVELLGHRSCSPTSRASAVKQASVSRRSTGPASVACRALRDESGPGSRPSRCAYNGGRVATTIRVAAGSCSHVVCV